MRLDVSSRAEVDQPTRRRRWGRLDILCSGDSTDVVPSGRQMPTSIKIMPVNYIGSLYAARRALHPPARGLGGPLPRRARPGDLSAALTPCRVGRRTGAGPRRAVA